ncbi:unnamed protein product [Amoebophrya sp. A120]|nr:unnamed protein product [Amoebophrya sp. A120]|eukprot:GSA120T00021267001.1
MKKSITMSKTLTTSSSTSPEIPLRIAPGRRMSVPSFQLVAQLACVLAGASSIWIVPVQARRRDILGSSGSPASATLTAAGGQVGGKNPVEAVPENVPTSTSDAKKEPLASTSASDSGGLVTGSVEVKVVAENEDTKKIEGLLKPRLGMCASLLPPELPALALYTTSASATSGNSKTKKVLEKHKSDKLAFPDTSDFLTEIKLLPFFNDEYVKANMDSTSSGSTADARSFGRFSPGAPQPLPPGGENAAATSTPLRQSLARNIDFKEVHTITHAAQTLTGQVSASVGISWLFKVTAKVSFERKTQTDTDKTVAAVTWENVNSADFFAANNNWGRRDTVLADDKNGAVSVTFDGIPVGGGKNVQDKVTKPLLSDLTRAEIKRCTHYISQVTYGSSFKGAVCAEIKNSSSSESEKASITQKVLGIGGQHTLKDETKTKSTHVSNYSANFVVQGKVLPYTFVDPATGQEVTKTPEPVKEGEDLTSVTVTSKTENTRKDDEFHGHEESRSSSSQATTGKTTAAVPEIARGAHLYQFHSAAETNAFLDAFQDGAELNGSETGDVIGYTLTPLRLARAPADAEEESDDDFVEVSALTTGLEWVRQLTVSEYLSIVTLKKWLLQIQKWNRDQPTAYFPSAASGAVYYHEDGKTPLTVAEVQQKVDAVLEKMLQACVDRVKELLLHVYTSDPTQVANSQKYYAEHLAKTKRFFQASNSAWAGIVVQIQDKENKAPGGKNKVVDEKIGQQLLELLGNADSLVSEPELALAILDVRRRTLDHLKSLRDAMLPHSQINDLVGHLPRVDQKNVSHDVLTGEQFHGVTYHDTRAAGQALVDYLEAVLNDVEERFDAEKASRASMERRLLALSRSVLVVPREDSLTFYQNPKTNKKTIVWDDDIEAYLADSNQINKTEYEKVCKREEKTFSEAECEKLTAPQRQKFTNSNHKFNQVCLQIAYYKGCESVFQTWAEQNQELSHGNWESALFPVTVQQAVTRVLALVRGQVLPQSSAKALDEAERGNKDEL